MNFLLLIKNRSLTTALSAVSTTATLALVCNPLDGHAQSPSQLPSVTVSSSRSSSASAQNSAGGISETPIAESPQSISVISSEQIKASGANSLSSVIRGESSVSDAYNTVGYIESLSVRGFLLNSIQNYRRDGLPISNHAPVVLENKEQIEVLKGVSGVQAGVSAPGGLVNYVLKRPTNVPVRSVGLQISERGTATLVGDLGGRSDDKRFGYRVNMALQDRRPAADNARGNRQMLSGFFDYRFPNQGILEWEFEHSRVKQISVPGYGLLDTDGDGFGDKLPRVPSPRSNLNSQPWSRPFESIATVGSIRYEQPIFADWKLGVRGAAQRIKTNDHLAFPDGCSSGANYVYPGLCGNGDVDIYDFRSDNERRKLNTGELYVKGDVQTGSIKHEINIGLRSTHYNERYEPQQAYNFAGTINAFAPTPLPPKESKNDLNTLLSSKTQELTITDAMQFGNAWSLWWGLKHTSIYSDSVRTDGSRPIAYQQSFNTPWVSLGYKPWQGGYLYGSAGQGVETEAVPNKTKEFANAGQALPALKSKQIELGLKQVVQVDGRNRGLFSAALFSIEKPYSDDIPATKGLVTRVAGARTAKHQGLELGYAGHLSKDWTGNIQATLLDARQTNDANNLFTNRRTTNAAPFTLAASAVWQIAPGVQWRNGVNFFSSKPVTRDNSVSLPAGWQLDTALTYTQKTGGSVLTWRAGIDNVFNRHYWREAPTQYWGGTYLFAAQPRTLRLGVTSSF
jgi:iron complex outermembrane recepter protein